jgi:hypothetical protein
VIWVCMKMYYVMNDLRLCEKVFCNEWSENTFSHNLRSLITEYVFTQPQITHYRIRFHTNSDHSLQITFSHKLRSLIIDYVFIQIQITHYRIRFHTTSDHSLQTTFSSVCVKTYSVMSDLNLCENVFCNEWSEFVWKCIM